jgi:hypothetical protein
VLWHTIAPLVPALLVALAVGVTIPWLIEGEVRLGGSYEYCTGTAQQCQTGDSPYLVKGSDPLVVMATPIPLGHLALLGGAALLAMLAVVGIGMLVQRRTLDLEELRAT